MEEKNIDELNDIDVLNDIKNSVRNTKYVERYSTEFRIFVYQLRIEHNLSYRKIIEFCQNEFGLSPTVGHIKKLITDGEKALKSRVKNPENNEEISDKKVNPARIRKAIEIIENRVNEIASKMVDMDVATLSEKDILELQILKDMYITIIEDYIEAIQSDRQNKE